MENLVYIHLASYQGENEDANNRANSEDVKVFQRIHWRKVSKRAWIHLLSLTIAFSSIGIATNAMAQMTQGNKGPEVTELQARLQKLGYFDRRPTGHFGPLTKQAVIRFQQDEGITANGVVEDTTLTALERRLQDNTGTTVAQTTPEPETTNTQAAAIDPSKQPTLRRGATGESVKALQQLLTDAGAYNGAIDGKFDLNTSVAVRQFQRSSRLMVDGIVGRNTWTALAKGNTQTQVLDPTFNNSPFTSESLTNTSDKPQTTTNRRTVIQASLKKGDRGQEVKSLQQRLQALGYYKGNTTGNFGPLTQEAVTRFQRQAGLTANGIVDSSTKAALLTPPSIRNVSVQEIQARLKERGFYKGPVNGSFNDETKAALKAAQKAYGVGENDTIIQPPE
jgi:peptidoglycan hydrolase-like protein with peptidoglycan-binding domain